jgi:hypothetical protein
MTELHKNLYEEVIDQMMIEEVAGLDNDIKKTLSNLDTSQKRLAILSILDNNRDLFLRIRKLITDNNVGKTEYITQVVTMLREYVKVAEIEQKKFAEVMTPITMVKEMLDTLPVVTFLVDSENEAKSLKSFLQTKFANYLLSLRKVSQDIKPDTCKWIPLVDLTQEWSDTKLYSLYNLTQDEIKEIESIKLSKNKHNL